MVFNLQNKKIDTTPCFVYRNIKEQTVAINISVKFVFKVKAGKRLAW